MSHTFDWLSVIDSIFMSFAAVTEAGLETGINIGALCHLTKASTLLLLQSADGTYQPVLFALLTLRAASASVIFDLISRSAAEFS